jgi:hypothetical protein
MNANGFTLKLDRQMGTAYVVEGDGTIVDEFAADTLPEAWEVLADSLTIRPPQIVNMGATIR